MRTGRRIAKASSKVKEPAAGTVALNETDSNADTCCLGQNFIVLSYTNRTADVFPYDSSYQPITNVPIVTGATAWDCPSTGSTYILVIHEGLYYGSTLDHSLINPNQIRHNGIDLWDNPFDPAHCLCIDIDRGPFIPLSITGTKVFFQTRSPTQHELHSCQHIELTSILPWNPADVTLGRVNTTDRNDIVLTEHDSWLYNVNPSLIMLKELFVQNIVSHSEQDDLHLDVPVRNTFISMDRHTTKSSQSLASLWGIGPLRAKATLRATTQHGSRSAILPLSRRYKADRRFNLKRLHGRFSTDTLYADVKSLHGNKYAQVFSQKNGFAVCYPLPSLSGDSIGYSLRDFCHDFGIPEHLTFDGAQSQVGKKTLFMETIRINQIDHHISEPYNPNNNPVEGSIRELKKRWYRIMAKKDVPKRLWDYGLVWICETGNLTVSTSRYANGRTPLEIITGETPDISEYTDFSFYDWVTFIPNAGLDARQYGRWLGVSHKVGPLMSYWILNQNCRVISCTTVQPISNSEALTEEWKNRFSTFDSNIKSHLKAQGIDASKEMSERPPWNQLTLDDEDQEFINDFNRVINDESVPEADDAYPDDCYDGYLNMEIGLPRGDDDNLVPAIVKRRALDDDGKPIGKPSNNPLTDSRKYEVEFDDGSIEVLPANVIAENILSQVDEEGHKQMMLKEIIDHRKDPKVAVTIEDGYYQNKYGTKVKKRTTKGWEICVEWKDGSTDWIALKDLKNSYPVELAQYAVDNRIDNEPAFNWWTSYTLKKGKRIIAKVKSKYWQRSHKYGIRVPKTVKEALEIDKENNNTYWADAIKDEMRKIRGKAVELYEGNPEELIGWQKITTHLIFDVKLGENFRRKARLVADGHKTNTPSSVTYSSVVSRDSVRICLLIAALNDLDVQGADVESAYLTAPCREKVWMIAGPEFGSDEGKAFLITKALYGLRSSGAAFRAYFAQTLDSLGFRPSIADPDVWMRAAVKPDGEEYYEYILVYTDDCLCVSYDASLPLKSIMEYFKFKKDKIEPPEFYLGARLERKPLNGGHVWTMTSKDYIKAIVKNLEERLEKKGMKLPNRHVNTPISPSFIPESDQSQELNENDTTMFQELIGELRWAIELGRVDILTEVSLLSAYQASPRLGHLEQLLHIFAFLKKRIKLTLYFDPTEPNIDQSIFQNNTPVETFKEQYRDATEELPHNMPTPRGRGVTTTAYVDASHAANKVTRRSHTGFILFVNRAPIVWFSKRQSTVESSTFSSEFIAMKTCMEHIVALRFKLRMFGIPFYGPTNVLCDNASVVKNSSHIESTLDKKHSSIAYHGVRWAVAAGIIRTGWIDGNFNLADTMTKRLSATKRDFLFGEWTY